MPPSDRDLLVLHAVFAVLSTSVLLLPLPVPTGWRVFGLVAVYVVAVPIVAVVRGHARWRSLIAFLWPLSACMLLPDWFLSHELGTLSFPDDGAPRVDTITLAMAGMWTIPLLLSTYAGARVADAGRRRLAPWVAAAVALAIFLGSEAVAPLLPLWAPTDRAWTVVGVAPYVLLPEVGLGLAVYVGWDRTRDDPWTLRVAVGLGIALAYLGALCVSWMAVG